MLVLESELNRAHLQREVDEVRQQVQAIGERLRSAGTLAGIVGSVISNLANHPPAASAQKPAGRSFFQLGNIARLATGMWKLFRSGNPG